MIVPTNGSKLLLLNIFIIIYAFYDMFYLGLSGTEMS